MRTGSKFPLAVRGTGGTEGMDDGPQSCTYFFSPTRARLTSGHLGDLTKRFSRLFRTTIGALLNLLEQGGIGSKHQWATYFLAVLKLIEKPQNTAQGKRTLPSPFVESAPTETKPVTDMQQLRAVFILSIWGCLPNV